MYPTIFIRIVDGTVQQCGHELHRIMRFEVGRLVRNQSVGDGVGFIETITCKIVDQVKDVVGLVSGFFIPQPSTNVGFSTQP